MGVCTERRIPNEKVMLRRLYTASLETGFERLRKAVVAARLRTDA